MADNNALELLRRGNARFAARQSLDTFRQEIALAFAPWLASWTTELVIGDDFASHLIDGTPLLLARDLAGQIGAMTRPPGKQYFWHRTGSDKLNNDREVRAYLDWRSSQMMRVIRDRSSGFGRATKQADEFFALFGDAVLSVDLSRDQKDIRVRNWHTKDCVWCFGDEGVADTITRKEMMPARLIAHRFGKIVHEKIREAAEKEPDKPFPVRHEVLPAADYEHIKKPTNSNAKFVSVWVDETNGCVLREVPQQTFRYVVPTWVRVSNWSYAISPATTMALPDARLIQQQAALILDASEKQLSPPVVAYSDSVRGTMSMAANHVNWVDSTIDYGTRQPIQPIELGKNFSLGVESLLRTEQQLTRAFYLDVLRMPDTRRTKSTAEVQFLIDEYIRAALPLFEPIQSDYIDPLLAEIDALIEGVPNGPYGNVRPDKLKNMESFAFAWDNPLSDMLERKKAQTVAEVSQVGQAIAALEAAAQQSPALKQLDTAKIARETWMGLGAASWLLSDEEAEKQRAAQEEANATQGALAAATEIAPGLSQMIDSGTRAAQATGQIPIAAEPSMPMLPVPV